MLNFNKVLVLAFGLAVFAGSCKKENPSNVANSNDDPATPGRDVPSIFTKKIVLENVTGEWSPSCPQGMEEIERLSAINPNLIPVALHSNDAFETPHTNYMSNPSYRYEVLYLPSAIIDRKKQADYTKSTWEPQVTLGLSETAKCGINLETSISGDELYITAKVVANELLSNANLSLYLVEDSVEQSAPGAQQGAAAGYVHRHVLRKVLSNSSNGEDLGITERRKIYTKNYTNINVAGYNQNNLYVVAIVNEYSFDPNELKSYNAQRVKVGEKSDW